MKLALLPTIQKPRINLQPAIPESSDTPEAHLNHTTNYLPDELKENMNER
jgi:hypothetical protein